MSMFKKPKKPVQLRIFSSEVENMDVDDDRQDDGEAKFKKRDKEREKKPQKSSLLSFGDEGIFRGSNIQWMTFSMTIALFQLLTRFLFPIIT